MRISSLLVLGSLLAAAASADLAIGDKAPAFTLQNVEGKAVSLADYAGHTVVLEWINPNCPFSRRHSEEKTMIGVEADHPEAVWLAINSTNSTHKDFLDPKATALFAAKHGIAYEILADADGSVGKAYGAKTTPHMFIIAADGTVAYNGAIDDNPRGEAKVNYVDAALSAIEKGAKPDPASTTPYGCSVKY